MGADREPDYLWASLPNRQVTIETRFDISFVADLALREKQIQQVYRPIIAVHKWFARRPGTLFRALLLSEFVDTPLRDSFFSAHDLGRRLVVDPFMGGGTPLIEANRLGCDVHGVDLNPMAAWVVKEELADLDLQAYKVEAKRLFKHLADSLQGLYTTRCPLFGDDAVPVKYFLWVKIIDCDKCGAEISLFPGYRIADDTRHPAHIFVCAGCGSLAEVKDPDRPGSCRRCAAPLKLEGPARKGACHCPACDHKNRYPRPELGPPKHRLFAIEYYNPARVGSHKGRFFKTPDERDLARFQEALERFANITPEFVPSEEIPRGDETNRLLRWGYRGFRDLFNARQLLGLELSCRYITAMRDERLRHAFATNLSDLLRYQNMLCRYDTMALKSLDVFSIHGFPIGLIQCESNLLGIPHSKGHSVGSGGWHNITEKYAKAKHYCDEPFEVKTTSKGKVVVPIVGEWIGAQRKGFAPRSIRLDCASSTELALEPESIDAVLTDPPYFGMVQYAELMEFCFVWLKQLVSHSGNGLSRATPRDSQELTANDTLIRGMHHYTLGLTQVFTRMAVALKIDAPLAFTFHHNDIRVYAAVGVALLDAGLCCTASIPCPAEMGGSIHIHGTSSSIVDTVFVCRGATERTRPATLSSPQDVRTQLSTDTSLLLASGYTPTRGDIRCILYGHLTRFAIAHLREQWDTAAPLSAKLALVSQIMGEFEDPAGVAAILAADVSANARLPKQVSLSLETASAPAL